MEMALVKVVFSGRFSHICEAGRHMRGVTRQMMIISGEIE